MHHLYNATFPPKVPLILAPSQYLSILLVVLVLGLQKRSTFNVKGAWDGNPSASIHCYLVYTAQTDQCPLIHWAGWVGLALGWRRCWWVVMQRHQGRGMADGFRHSAATTGAGRGVSRPRGPGYYGAITGKYGKGYLTVQLTINFSYVFLRFFLSLTLNSCGKTKGIF